MLKLLNWFNYIDLFYCINSTWFKIMQLSQNSDYAAVIELPYLVKELTLNYCYCYNSWISKMMFFLYINRLKFQNLTTTFSFIYQNLTIEWWYTNYKDFYNLLTIFHNIANVQWGLSIFLACSVESCPTLILFFDNNKSQ